MDDAGLERRESKRFECRDLVTLVMMEGEYKGASLVGMVTNFSAGGVCMVLDGGWFLQGTPLRIEFQDGLTLEGRVRHCTRRKGASEIGISVDTGDPSLLRNTGAQEATAVPID